MTIMFVLISRLFPQLAKTLFDMSHNVYFILASFGFFTGGLSSF